MILENNAFKKLKILKTKKYFDPPMKKLHNRSNDNVHQVNWDIGLVESFSQKIVLGQEISFVLILEYEIVKILNWQDVALTYTSFNERSERKAF